MKSMLILSQCLDVKSMLSDLSYELRILICLVITVLALSVLKIVYYHFCSTYNVRRIKQLLETKRPFHVNSRPISPLPKIERVPTSLSIRRRSIKSSTLKQSSSESSLDKEQDMQRSTNTSTAERTQTSPRRRKNQIVASEILL